MATRHPKKVHPRERAKAARIERARKFKAMFEHMTADEIARSQTPPISGARVLQLIHSLDQATRK